MGDEGKLGFVVKMRVEIVNVIGTLIFFYISRIRIIAGYI